MEVGSMDPRHYHGAMIVLVTAQVVIALIALCR
jgi:hypothetical protein